MSKLVHVRLRLRSTLYSRTRCRLQRMLQDSSDARFQAGHPRQHHDRMEDQAWSTAYRLIAESEAGGAQ